MIFIFARLFDLECRYFCKDREQGKTLNGDNGHARCEVSRSAHNWMMKKRVKMLFVDLVVNMGEAAV
jgi:hypothetical protein